VTIAAATDAATQTLVDAGFPRNEARRDAAVIARHCLNWTLTDWAIRSREVAPPGFTDRLFESIRRRATREPVAYVTGVREFYGRDFRVTNAVLIPRPETESLVEETLEILAGSSPAFIVDVGTGSGCVAITLALECPSARVMATDVSAAALDVARANAQALGATGVEFIETSLIPAAVTGLDVIVSNPPYVPQRHRASLPVDVRDFEPSVALFGGEDGQDVIGRLIAAARQTLKPGGSLIMEIGDGQAQAVTNAVAASGLHLTRIRQDLQNISRVVVARQPSAS
jgi:release factor glutamine methyltransferase